MQQCSVLIIAIAIYQPVEQATVKRIVSSSKAQTILLLSLGQPHRKYTIFKDKRVGLVINTSLIDGKLSMDTLLV